MGELLSPKVDFVFKQIFGTEDHQDILLNFLNAVFEDAGQPLMTHVEILNPFLEKDALSDKMSVLDVKARSQTGLLVDIEIQLQNHRNMEQRTLYYWSKLFQGQLSEGGSYRALHKAVTVNILDFDYLPTERYHSTFHLHEDVTGLVLTDLLEVHFVELRKIGTQPAALGRQMLFLTTKTREGLEALAMEEPAIKKALTTLEFLSQDERARQLYEDRQKALMTYTADIDGAREEGREEGEQIGIEKVARALLRAGDSVDKVMTITGLSREAVDALKPH